MASNTGVSSKSLQMKDVIPQIDENVPLALLFGASHVNHLTDFLHREHIANFNLNNRRIEVQQYGISGMRMHARDYIVDDHLKSFGHHCHYIDLTHPEYVLFLVGSNDISNPHNTMSDIATSLYSAARYTLLAGARKVAILQLFPRRNASFNDKAAILNAILAQKIQDGNEPNVVFWRHRGLHNPEVDIYKPDGVHLNDVGNYRLFRSVRGCVLYMAH